MIACPIPFETLTALWAGELAPELATPVEEHVFGCDRCSATSERLGELVQGLRELLPPVISHALRDRLVARGLRVKTTTVDVGVQAHARFTPDVDLLIHVLRGDLSRADRVDVELVDPTGHPHVEMVHVPFDPQTGEVLIACQRHYEQFPFEPGFRVHVFEQGTTVRVCDYAVHHQWR
ncbi:MAG: hypothetical protein H0T42_07245 [Deltaproteobacteria bacterium]|nr:hypothetical protein [Deltaproteobacteria bacterium]